jgi:pyruvate dehydrogenase E2 component (dihydrolipoamide acetyltransferase)
VRILVPAGSPDVPVNEVIGIIASEEEAACGEIARSRTAAETIEPIRPIAAADGSAHASSQELSAARPTPPSQSHSSEGANGSDAIRLFASPIARRLMSEAGLDAASIDGSGPHGRIIERDVTAAPAFRALAARKATTPAVAPANIRLAGPVSPQTLASDAGKAAGLFEPGGFEEVAHDSMRLTIARRLSDAKRTVPHFYVSADCAIDDLLELKERFNGVAAVEHGEGQAIRLSVNDFVVRALALALARVPDANVSFTEEALLRHRHADIGVAVAILGGLVTPIIRRAETKTLSTISTEMKDLAARAKARKLRPEEYQGGTASVSNLGMYGVRNFAAILNPPQATILAVGAAERRVVVRDGAPAVATVMTVTLSADHRAVDGATAAQLLSKFKALIEEPMAMLV